MHLQLMAADESDYGLLTFCIKPDLRVQQLKMLLLEPVEMAKVSTDLSLE